MLNQLLAATLLLSLVAGARASDACSNAYWSAAAVGSLQECRRAAESGEPESELGYGLVFWSGHDRTGQPREAVEWFRRSAKHGHQLAMVMLGRFLTDVRAPAEIRDLPEGYAWWVVSGEKDAASELKQRLSPTELADGERLAKEFTVKYAPAR
jgi:TPR repeat protein